VVDYVGITFDPVRRCRDHGYGPPNTDGCQELMVVPSRGVAAAVEQYLMEVYGFAFRPTNTNYDTGNVRTRGWFDGRPAALRNLRRNFSAKRFRTLYCAAINIGYHTINLWRPQLAGQFPPRDNYWWPNFPGRDCFDVAQLQSFYQQLEGHPPANPRG
jgi:hypothetical protein